ncbi:MAG TPA: alpha/beta fold hydrolase [Candidatus Dormibacteraeota bacterium]
MLRDYQVETADGRQLDVVESGQVGDPLVLVHHGTPGARTLAAPWIADAEHRGIRLVGYSRPGYGESTRVQGRPVSQVAEDMRAIADHLGVDRLATWGYSGGGPHVLATAALLPDLVVAAAAIASPAPYGADGLDFLAGMGEANVKEFDAVLAGEAATRPLHEAAAAEKRDTVDAVIEGMASLLSAPDLEVTRATLGEWMIAVFAEGLAQGADGWIDDDLAFVAPWGFALSDIRVPLQLWQGRHDLMVPLAHGEWLARQLPRAEWNYRPEGGHLSLLVEAVPEIHSWLLGHF